MQLIEVYDKKQAASILKISVVTLDRLWKAGLLTHRRIGAQVRFLPEDIKEYLERAAKK